MAKSYHQYCPIAHALDMVGERWSLLIVRELLARGPLRYSDLHESLDGCGTNILAARLRELERCGVISRRRLAPPAASNVYELTAYGQELRPVIHQLAHWGLRSLGPPTQEVAPSPGWLPGALRTAFPPNPTEACVEFRIDDECAAFVDGLVHEGSGAHPDAVVEGSLEDFYHLMVDRDVGAVAIRGRRSAVEQLLATLPRPAVAPVPA